MKMEFDADISLERISELFEEFGWMYAVPGCYGVPSEADIKRQVFRMVRTMDEEDLDYLQNGRLALVRDDTVKDTFHVLITAGYLYAGEEVEFLDD